MVNLCSFSHALPKSFCLLYSEFKYVYQKSLKYGQCILQDDILYSTKPYLPFIVGHLPLHSRGIVCRKFFIEDKLIFIAGKTKLFALPIFYIRWDFISTLKSQVLHFLVYFGPEM